MTIQEAIQKLEQIQNKSIPIITIFTVQQMIDLFKRVDKTLEIKQIFNYKAQNVEEQIENLFAKELSKEN
jgi:hypothetical protein